MPTKDDVEAAKRSNNLVETVRSRGIKLDRHGPGHRGRCPFCKARTASLLVRGKKGTWSCTSCDAAGDVIDFVAKAERVTRDEAVRMLKGAGSIETRAIAEGKSEPKAEGPPEESSDEPRQVRRLKLLGRVSGFYENDLARDKRGVEYLKSLGIEDLRTLKDLRVGFASGGLMKVTSPGEIEDLSALGIFDAKGKEALEGCVTVPLLDSNGQVVALYGKGIVAGKPQDVYLPPKPKGLVNRDSLREGKPVVLVETVLDALTLYAKGLRRVMPVLNRVEDEIVPALLKGRIRQVFVALHGDEEGRWAAGWVSGQLAERGILARTIELPEADLVRFFQAGRTLADFEALLLAASPAHEKTGAARLREETGFETTSTGFTVTYGDRHYEARGIGKQGTGLRVVLRASNEDGSRSEVSTLDLYSHRSRESFARTLSEILDADEHLVREDLRRILDKAEAWQGPVAKVEAPPPMSAQERAEAIAFLKQPDLVDRIAADFDAIGYIGSRTNALVAYLAATSRLLDEPLSAIVQSRSSAGKSALLDAVVSLLPPEAFLKYTRITSQAPYYLDERALEHKALVVEEVRGAEATYAILALLSGKMITLVSTAKDPKTGKAAAYERRVRGPVAVLTTTTEPRLDGDLASRCLVLSVDESKELTERIHELQRQSMTLAGLGQRIKREAVRSRHWNVQRCLKPLRVVNELAPDLRFSTDRLRSRRDQVKYLSLINAVALLHQHQREVKRAVIEGEEVEYIEVLPDDVRRANEIAEPVFTVSLDELSQGSRRLLKAIDSMVRARMKERGSTEGEIPFTRREIREWLKWSDAQVREYLRQLVDLEILQIRQGRRGKVFVYLLGYDPQAVRLDLVAP